MLRLIRFELHKLIRQKSFYICLAVLILMLVFSAYTSELMLDGADAAAAGLSGTDYMIEASSGSVLIMVLGVFIPLFVCEDYASGAIRNIVTRGYTRLGIFSAKLIAVLISAVIMTAAGMAAAYLVGTIFWGAGDISFDAELIKVLLCQIAVAAAAASLFYAISTVLQKTGGSIAICLVLPMVAVIVLSLIDTALAEHELELSSYWIERVGSSLAHAEPESEVIKKALLVSLGYFLASTAGAWILTMKREY